MSEENIRMTRISDLPEIPLNNQIMQSTGEPSTMYIPMNVHPNPFGIGAQPPGGIEPPQPQQQYIPPQNQNVMLPTNVEIPQQEYRLPVQDVPVRNVTQEFMHDEEIKPNYIPKPKITADYIKEYEAATAAKATEYKKEKEAEQKREEWVEILQTPILIGILYFIFQLPVVNTLIFKRLSFLNIYREDGNFNIWGLLMKASLFSSAFWVLDESIYHLTKYLV